tara:strand:+ start:694 stop:1335 length:642 start_codon:yes stop_codon:yes gene_type:complete
MISKEKKKEYNKKLKELHKIKLSFEESKKKSKEKKRIGTNALGKTPGRLCKYCNEQKHFKEFRELQKGRGWKAQNGSARYPQCLVCERIAAAKRYRLNGIHQKYNGARTNAKKKGVPFEISKEYLIQLLANAPDKCPVFGTKFVINRYTAKNKENKGSFRDDSVSLDRIIPELGYVEGNLVIVSDLANRIKTNATPEQIIKVGEFYKKLLKKK